VSAARLPDLACNDDGGDRPSGTTGSAADTFAMPNCLRDRAAVFRELRWQSVTLWPGGTRCTAEHASKGLALKACATDEIEGLNGQRKVFPVETRAEPLAPEDIRGRSRRRERP
jgi:hypothetical protein